MDYVYLAPSGSFSQRNGLSWAVLQTNGNSFVDRPERVAAFVASLSCPAGASQASMTWPSVPGREYQVLFSEDLDLPFVLQATYSAGSAEVMSISVSKAKAKGFFKVVELSED